MTIKEPVEIQPNIQAFFQQYPVAEAEYGSISLYHLTLGTNVAGILEEGLQPTPELFPSEHGRFLLRIFDRYGNNDPSSRDYIQDRILGAGTVYLSANEPDMAAPGYGVPERLMLLMRGLHTLRNKTAITYEERAYAEAAFDQHYDILTRPDQTITALRIDPLAPSVVNARLGSFYLSQVADEEDALLVAHYVDGSYGNNIAVSEPIEPSCITVHASTPLTHEVALRGVYAEPQWTTSLR